MSEFRQIALFVAIMLQAGVTAMVAVTGGDWITATLFGFPALCVLFHVWPAFSLVMFVLLILTLSSTAGWLLGKEINGLAASIAAGVGAGLFTFIFLAFLYGLAWGMGALANNKRGFRVTSKDSAPDS